jgi:hypothetical protein
MNISPPSSEPHKKSAETDGKLLYYEDGGDMFLLNVGIFLFYYLILGTGIARLV